MQDKPLKFNNFSELTSLKFDNFGELSFDTIYPVKENKLIIQINSPVSDIFTFTTTPPNSKLWINSIVDEETNEWPVQVGTIYSSYCGFY